MLNLNSNHSNLKFIYIKNNFKVIYKVIINCLTMYMFILSLHTVKINYKLIYLIIELSKVIFFGKFF